MTNSARSISASREVFLGVSFALLAAVGFSVKAILLKLAYLDSVDAVTMLALRMAFSLPFFVLALFWLRRQQAVPALTRHEFLLITGLGLIGYYASSFMDFLGLEYISASLERLILFLYPTITVILAAILYRRVIPRIVIAAMVLSYAGIALVFLHDVGAQHGNVMLGSLLVFASTLSYSVYLVGAGHAIARLGSIRFTASAMIVASIASLLQFVLIRPLAALDLPLRVYEITFAMAIFSTVLPVFLLSFAIHRIGSGNTSLIGSIGPVSTIYLAYVILGEHISAMQIGGAVLVLIGVLVVSLNSNKQ